MSSPPPPVGGLPEFTPSLEKAERAIQTVKNALPYFNIGPLLRRPHPPEGAVSEVPLLYNGVALDRLVFDPERRVFLPKGSHPVPLSSRVEQDKILEYISGMMGELRVVEAVECRMPEKAYAVPLAWRHYIVAHVKVSENGEELIPDYPLTMEVSGRAPRL